MGQMKVPRLHRARIEYELPIDLRGLGGEMNRLDYEHWAVTHLGVTWHFGSRLWPALRCWFRLLAAISRPHWNECEWH